jgi:hypothetical protein
MLALRPTFCALPASAPLRFAGRQSGTALPGLVLASVLITGLGFVSSVRADLPPSDTSRSHLASVPVEEDAPPVQAMGQTFLLNPAADQTIGATSWPMVSSVPGSSAPTFVPAVSMPVSLEAMSQEASAVTVMWTLSIGTLVSADGQSMASGALRADVAWSSADPNFPGCHTIAAISAIPSGTAITLQQAMAESTFLPPPVQSDDPDNAANGNFCLGTTCSCGTCSNGTRFAAPLFVVGICNRAAGNRCCAPACDLMCNSQAGGLSPAEAWIQGQGMFVICMLAQPES